MILKALVLAFALVLCLAQFAKAAENNGTKPNIVFIVIDDLGYADIGYRNDNEIDTPHLNSIVGRGIDLQRYYVHTVCSPSRAALMTGRFSHHTGVHNWLHPIANIAVELDEVFLSQKLKDAGYATHMVGKWHLGHHKWSYTPTYRGFDTYFGYYTGGGDYFMGRCDSERYWFQYLDAKAPNCNEEETCVRIPWEIQVEYSTEVFSRKAVEVVERHAAHERDKPLFLYLAFQAMHAGFFQPNQVPPYWVEPYLKRMGPGQRRQFAGALAAVDSAVGNLTDVLERNGFTDENTLIIVSTDNGGPVHVGDAVGARNTPYRGGKHCLYEGGVRGVAFLAGYGIKRKGKSYSALMHITDWFATLADVAGFSLETKRPLDSVSHWARLSADSDEELADAEPLRTEIALGNVSDYGYGFGMIIDDDEGHQWKIIADSPGYPSVLTEEDPASDPHGLETKGKSCHNGFCLFELTSDPQESNDLAEDPAYASILAKLRKRILQEIETFHDIPKDCDIEATPRYELHVGNAWWPYCPDDDDSHVSQEIEFAAKQHGFLAEK